jgi:hypothetical protein
MFFMDASLIVQHPRWEYLAMLDKVHEVVVAGYCNTFQRKICETNPMARALNQGQFNFLVGGVFERSWAAMFTGASELEWL